MDVNIHPKDGGSRQPGAVKVWLDDQDDTIEPNLSYRFFGHWETYTNKRSLAQERQFVCRTFVKARPHGRAGVIKYLTGAPGIGRILATRLWEAFEGDAVKILRREPEHVAKLVRGLSAETAAEASAYLVREQAMEDCRIALASLLADRGFPKSAEKAAIKEFGNQAAALIEKNPYLLMRFRGCGFLLADRLYTDLKYNPARIKRQALCGWYAISSLRTGSTWHYRGVADSELAKKIAGADVQQQKAIELAKRGGLLASSRTDGMWGPLDWDGSHEWLADSRMANNEIRLALAIAKAVKEGVE